jgi:hypothetical protein
MQEEAISFFLGRLVTLGCFPPHPPLLPTNTSFWSITLPNMPSHSISRSNPSQPAFQNEEGNTSPLPERYFSTRLLSAMTLLPVSQQLVIVTSLLWHLDLTVPASSNPITVSLDGTDKAGGVVKRESLVLWQAIGDIMAVPSVSGKPKSAKEGEFGAQLLVWPLISAFLDKGFTESVARVIVCWAAQSTRPESGKFLQDKIMQI